MATLGAIIVGLLKAGFWLATALLLVGCLLWLILRVIKWMMNSWSDFLCEDLLHMPSREK